MTIALCKRATFLDYINVLKPVETSLLAFIGIFSAIIAGSGYVQTMVTAEVTEFLAHHRADPRLSVEKGCQCYTCRHFSRA